MKIVYSIPEHVDDLFYDLVIGRGHDAIRIKSASFFPDYPDADLYIDGTFSGVFIKSEQPLLIHCPAITWENLSDAPANSARFCAWPGFWERDIWEYVPNPNCRIDWSLILISLGIRGKEVSDIAGLIAPRILATIINEAVYCVDAQIAGADDIDIAMRLGTNYPMGPIEWAKKIGVDEVYKLLASISAFDDKYTPHLNFREHLQ